jgi:hypothetical protein
MPQSWLNETAAIAAAGGRYDCPRQQERELSNGLQPSGMLLSVKLPELIVLADCRIPAK